MTAPPKFTGTGLEEVNIPGQAYLREALTSCTDPLKAIESFQVLKFTVYIINIVHIKILFSWRMESYYRPCGQCCLYLTYMACGA